MSEIHSDALVFFGATGDLAYKKIFPSLQAMLKRGHLDVPVVGVAKAGWTVEQLRARARDSLEKHGGLDAAAFDKLSGLLRYVDGDYADAATFQAIRKELGAAQVGLGTLQIRLPRGLVARRGAGEQAVNIQPLQGRREQTDCRQFAGPTSDPVEHREASEPILGRCRLVHLRTRHGDGDSVARELQASRLVGLGHQQHPVARFWSAATLGSDKAERLTEPARQELERSRNAVRVGVVHEVNVHRVRGRVSRGIGHKHRAQRGATDADGEHTGESWHRGRTDRAGMYTGSERLDVGGRLSYLGGDLRALEPGPALATSSGRPCASRPGWRWRRLPARP
jgi:hypothetical protein